MTFWLRSKCSICSIIFGTVKVVGCISCTVYTYCIARELTPNNEVFRILSLSLGFPIVGEVEMRYYLNRLAVGLRCYDFMVVLLVEVKRLTVPFARVW